MTFDLLEEQISRHRGSKEYLKVSELAAKERVAGVDAVLRVLLAAGDEQISEGKDRLTPNMDGRIRSTEYLALRVPSLNRKELSILARVGALNSIDAGAHRRDTL